MNPTANGTPCPATPRPRFRRSHPRYPYREGRPVEMLPEHARSSALTARAYNASRTGIGLLCDRPLAAGEAVLVALPARLAADEPLTLQARVAHATRVAEGRWLVGCQFLRPLYKGQLAKVL